MTHKDTGYTYIGRMPCGCIVSACVDRGDKHTAKSVAEMIKEGETVERVTHEYFLENCHFTIYPKNCPHQKPQGEQLPLFQDSSA